MEITDIEGQKMMVTDLAAAIKQAVLFKQYRHKDAGRGKRDDELKIYWSDIHSKLLELHCTADAGK